MNAFEKAVNVIFKDKNFLEACIINGQNYDCICTSIEDSLVYGDAGLVDDVNFTLSIKLPIHKMPKIGDSVKFRGITYKISLIDVDSANTSISIHLQSNSKR